MFSMGPLAIGLSNTGSSIGVSFQPKDRSGCPPLCAHHHDGFGDGADADAGRNYGAWIQPRTSSFYSPDVAEWSVDFGALAVIHLPASEKVYGSFCADEMLLHSEGFGLVVVDLTGVALPRTFHTSWQGRLLFLVREHQATVLFLSEKTSASDSIGPLIGLGIEPQWHRVSSGVFEFEYRLLKNKAGFVGDFVEKCRGSNGLR